MSMLQPETQLPVDAAYEAARVRALRTTEALILAEGQVMDLRRQLAEVTEQRDRYATEAGKAAAARSRRRMRDRARRAHKRSGCSGPHCPHCDSCVRDGGCINLACRGVSDGAEESDPVGYTGAVGQAD